VLVLLGGLILVPTALAFWLPEGSEAWVLANKAADLATTAVMLVGILRLPRGSRTVWWLLWAMSVVLVLADAVYDTLLYGLGVSPIPSPADVLYVAAYIPQILALALLVRRREPGQDRAAALDTALLTLALGSITLVLVVHPVVDGTVVVGPELVMALVYPAIDVVVLAVLLRLLVGGTEHQPAMSVLTLSMAVTLGADLAYNAVLLDGVDVAATAWTQYIYLAGEILLVAAVFLRGADTLAEPVTQEQGVRPFRAWLIAVGCMTPVLLVVWTAWTAAATLRVVSLLALAAVALGMWRGWMLVQTVNRQAAQLAEQARTDALTGLPNRRTWDHQLVRSVSEAAASGRPLSLALLDLDRFKAFNDGRGHQAGDALLRDAATAWRAEVPTGAFLARYGGEEFALLLPGLEGPAVQALLDRVRAATPHGQTVSIGWSTLAPGEASVTLLLHADQALFQAKQQGRDRVEQRHDGPPASPLLPPGRHEPAVPGPRTDR
jgi:diguanylate cyclase (GGDEF)-like protein